MNLLEPKIRRLSGLIKQVQFCSERVHAAYSLLTLHPCVVHVQEQMRSLCKVFIPTLLYRLNIASFLGGYSGFLLGDRIKGRSEISVVQISTLAVVTHSPAVQHIYNPFVTMVDNKGVWMSIGNKNPCAYRDLTSLASL
jgi:hypothetical protein